MTWTSGSECTSLVLLEPLFTNARSTLLYDEQAMELILTCWTHMSAPNRDDVNALVHKFYEDHGGCRACSIDPDRHERAVHIIGVDTLIQKFEEWLTVRQLSASSAISVADGPLLHCRPLARWTSRCASSCIRSMTS